MVILLMKGSIVVIVKESLVSALVFNCLGTSALFISLHLRAYSILHSVKCYYSVLKKVWISVLRIVILPRCWCELGLI